MPCSRKKILLVRSHVTLNAGGPVPPMGLLYLASSITTHCPEYEVAILHFGVHIDNLDDFEQKLKILRPDFVGISSLTCEAQLLSDIARTVKTTVQSCVVLAGGPHASLVQERLLDDDNIDFVFIGEGEKTIVEFLKAFPEKGGLSHVAGLAYRTADGCVKTAPRQPLDSLDDYPIIPSVWDLIDIHRYAAYDNWNGIRKEKDYAPIVSSRGCPFSCTFCRSRDIFGSTFRARTAQHVVSEIRALYEQYRIREFHFYDDVFNFDVERAKQICSLLIDSQLPVHIAFPNGMRIDRMSEELIGLLRKAGTYKINYGIETVNQDVLERHHKSLNTACVSETINRTAATGIITTGYFIFGLPGDTTEDMLKTISFAVHSNLDNAYFFKHTDFTKQDTLKTGARDFHFHSKTSRPQDTVSREVDGLIVEAQRKFYFHPRRFIRGLIRTQHKYLFLKGYMRAIALMLVSYMTAHLTEGKHTP